MNRMGPSSADLGADPGANLRADLRAELRADLRGTGLRMALRAEPASGRGSSRPARRPAGGAGRRWRAGAAATATAAAALAMLLAACAGSPPTRWYELRTEPPPSAASAASAAAAAPGERAVWELSGRVPLPGALDRETLMLASGTAGLQALNGHRWAEPLRDSVPRLLLHDLTLLRGAGTLWAAPAPAGVQPARRLSVELQTLLADAGRTRLRLQARWWLAELQPAAGLPQPAPALHSTELSVPIADASADALAAAHRKALWCLAERIAAPAGAPAGAPAAAPAGAPPEPRRVDCWAP